ncbi:hypothetical protein MJO28_016646, partial [Puccinia striiformis f. sp. tritici]
MLSSSSFTSLEKAIINHVLPSDHHRILAAGLCLIYHAYPDPNKCKCTFWHAFQGDDCMITFVFVNEDEALV